MNGARAVAVWAVVGGAAAAGVVGGVKVEVEVEVLVQHGLAWRRKENKGGRREVTQVTVNTAVQRRMGVVEVGVGVGVGVGVEVGVEVVLAVAVAVAVAAAAEAAAVLVFGR